MLLVIFGAGASYDSVPHLPPPRSIIDRQSRSFDDDRLPLANELFENRAEFVRAMEQFKDCMPLIPLLRRPGVAVERELARIQQQASAFPQVHRELMAIRYYLHYALWQCQQRWYGHHRGINNYVTLMREIERWRFDAQEQVCLVTFNYETMLEDAMSQVLKFEVRDMDSYSWQGNYSLIKLHGSVNWGRELDGIENPGNYDQRRIISEAADLQISNRYRLVSGPIPILRHQEFLVVPALSIPVDKKDEFSCPNEHVAVLEGLLLKTTKVLVIGWRATEAEFLRIFKSRTPNPLNLMIVSGDEKGATGTLNSLTSGMSYHPTGWVVTGFTGLITQKLGMLEEFLRDTKGTAAGA